MSGITGIVNFKDKNLNTDDYISTLKNMTKSLENRGPDAEDFFSSPSVIFGHRRLAVIDIEGGAQPMTREYFGNKYTIVCNGELYNTEEIKKELKEKGFNHTTSSGTETILLGYICFGKEILNKLIGAFAFAIYDETAQKVFLARDHFGVKPLYYSLVDNCLIFASEQQAILESKLIKAQIDKQGLQELFAFSPLKTPGITIFKNIFELKSGEMAEFDNNGITKQVFYKIEARTHTDNLKQTTKNVRNLVVGSIKSQLVSDVGICAFLSGGLDSSIITAVVAKELKKKRKKLSTFSVDFKDNDKYFKKSIYQPSQDEVFIKLMSNKFKTNHTDFVLDSKKTLSNSLLTATKARGVPGMADIDSSFLLFCKEVKKTNTVALSGECADEIFCGYPWFFKEESINSNFFPFLNEDNEKLYILKESFAKKIEPQKYVRKKYEEAIKETPLLGTETEREKKLKQLQYLCIKYFMQNLIERTDKMSMFCGLEVRAPFCDRRIVDYVYNIPFEMKLLNGREKGLLRTAVKGLLPKQIVERKKAPYPKTHNPEYFKIVTAELKERLKDKNCKLRQFISTKKLNELMSSSPDLSKPWVGQLMARPQLIASLIQMDEWFKMYDVEVLN